MARLPKAIQAILTDYRGVRVQGIPEGDIPGVLVRRGRAAAALGKLPQQRPRTSEAYHRLADALRARGRSDDVRSQSNWKISSHEGGDPPAVSSRILK